jgi:hypothetical protein
MSSETQATKSLLSQVRDEANKAKREAAKAKLKTLYSDYNKAVDVVTGVEQQIVELLREFGENEAAVKSLLASE